MPKFDPNGSAVTIDVGRIPEVTIPTGERKLRFSFKHLDTTHHVFSPAYCEAEYHCALLERIKALSSWTVDQFCDHANNEHRHIIDFAETVEKDGFSSVEEEQLLFTESWQFEVMPKTLWRVHGFLIEDTFYVIWLDPNHQLYPLPS
jgi:hypothetical protein